RFWKFGLVGSSGLVLFLALIWLLVGPARIAPLVAFLPAFAVSFIWNSALNWLWTFADQRRSTAAGGLGHYWLRSLLAGVLMYAIFAALLGLGLSALLAGALAALSGMAANGLISRRSVRDSPSAWA